MAYYYTCPHCGTHLDPGESCDCQKQQEPDEAEREISASSRGQSEVLYANAV